MPKQQTSITLEDNIHASLQKESMETGLAISSLIELKLRGFVIHNRILLATEIMIEKFAMNIQGYYVRIMHNFDGYHATWEGICKTCHKKKSLDSENKDFANLLKNIEILLEFCDNKIQT